MSFGIVYCANCKREVHQDGGNRSWRHCDDKTTICAGFSAEYVDNVKDIVGKWCGRDK